ncbi:MAG: hypothetical protein LUD22_04050 [Coprobacillus sp.]|nr:hypothetical protein [Coprobacillus sp.]
MKKEKFIVLITVLVFSLTGCNSTFDPFDFNNVEIISSEEARYISDEATNNLSYVSSLAKSESSIIDYRIAYDGSASSIARYQESDQKESISIYANYAYQIDSKTKQSQGDGSGNVIYFETDNTDVAWLVYSEDEEQYPYYSLYQVNEYDNPNYSYDPIVSSKTSYFSSVDDVYLLWDKQIRNLVSDSYSYSDFSYGEAENKIYGFNEQVSQNTITNPLHSDEIIITYTERMVVRYFRYDNTYGWVIDYTAEKINLYWITSLDGEMYDSPLLVESSETLYQYNYGNRLAAQFNYPEQVQTTDSYPIIYSYRFDSENNLYLYTTQSLSNAYLVSNYGDSEYTYLAATVSFYSNRYYLFKSSSDEYSDEFFGYDIINYDQLNFFSLYEYEGLNYLSLLSNVSLYLVFGFTKDGEIYSLDAYYWSSL